LDNILNEVEGVFSVGEVRFLWDRVLEDRLCGCRRRVTTCPVWSAVLASAGIDRKKVQVIARWQNDAVRVRNTWQILRASRSHRVPSATLESFRQVMRALYIEIFRVTGAKLIVDSSKRSSNAALLASIPELDPFFLHLVRDPRGVAYSRQRRKINPDSDVPMEMGINRPTNSAMAWLGWNVSAEAVVLRQDPRRVVRLRYEDFANDPAGTVASILDFVGEGGKSLPFKDQRTVHLTGNHTVSGNPARFSQGEIQIREDDAWHRELPAGARNRVAALTLPLILRYGYSMRSTD
jgi:hypothetical protein